MEREYVLIENIIALAQNSNNNFSINGKFLIISVIKKTATNGTPYFKIKLEDKTGILNAKRFTSGGSEFESLNPIYLLGNIVELEGIYQYKWNSVKITSEKLIRSSTEELPREIQALLKEQNDKIGQLIKITEFSATIHVKTFMNALIKPFFKNTSKRKIKKLKKSIEQYLKVWPENKRKEFWGESCRAIKRYEDMQPSKWKKWVSNLIGLIFVLRA